MGGGGGGGDELHKFSQCGGSLLNAIGVKNLKKCNLTPPPRRYLNVNIIFFFAHHAKVYFSRVLNFFVVVFFHLKFTSFAFSQKGN